MVLKQEITHLISTKFEGATEGAIEGAIEGAKIKVYHTNHINHSSDTFEQSEPLFPYFCKMTENEIRHIISHGEGISIEFKEARNALPANVFESVCAFLNRQGGHLFLGVKDDGTIVGVDQAKITKMKTEFATTTNNPNKINPPDPHELSEIKIGSVSILYTYISQSSQVHRCDGLIFDRSEDGDIKVKSDANISKIYSRKSNYYTENYNYPLIKISDFKAGLLEKVRQLIKSNSPDHPWLALPDMEFLIRAGLWQKDFKSGEEGFTRAAVLLLGRDEVIHSVLPHYRIDAYVRINDLDRYDDRLDIRTNLIDAYELLMDFTKKHLPDQFFISDDQRINLRDRIFREVVANFIVHREYANASPARFVIFKDRVEIDNANKPNGHGPINPEKFSPFPKNPTIAKFFAQLGRVEELGSGIRIITTYLKNYSPGAKATFIEEDTFKTTIPINRIDNRIPQRRSKIELDMVLKMAIKSVPDGLSSRIIQNLGKISVLLFKQPGLIAEEIALSIEKSFATTHRYLSILKQSQIIESRGHAKTSGYFITNTFKDKISIKIMEEYLSKPN
jgi:ATP-dependent DNA helicase RecG